MDDVCRRIDAAGGHATTMLGPSTIVLREVGSTAHRISAGDDDLDLMGVRVDAPDAILGLRPARPLSWRSAAWRTGCSGAPSRPGDIDLVIYGLREFMRHAMRGNPSILMVIHHPRPLLCDEVGRALRALAPGLASQRVVRSFLGFARSQMAHLEGRRPTPPSRAQRVARDGLDTKRAAHVMRLVHQGLAYAHRREYPIPLPEPIAERVRRVRTGVITPAEIMDQCRHLCADLERAERSNPTGLPPRPEPAPVERFLIEAHMRCWDRSGGWGAGAVTGER